MEVHVRDRNRKDYADVVEELDSFPYHVEIGTAEVAHVRWDEGDGHLILIVPASRYPNRSPAAMDQLHLQLRACFDEQAKPRGEEPS